MAQPQFVSGDQIWNSILTGHRLWSAIGVAHKISRGGGNVNEHVSWAIHTDIISSIHTSASIAPHNRPDSNSSQSGSRFVMSRIAGSAWGTTRAIEVRRNPEHDSVKIRTWNEEVETEAAISIARPVRVPSCVGHPSLRVDNYDCVTLSLIWPVIKWLLLNTKYRHWTSCCET